MLGKRKYRWEIVTSIEKKERGIIVMLDSLEENSKSQKSASKLTSTQINTEDSLKPLLEKLDLVFKSRKNNDAYDAYSKFISFQKDQNVSMIDYIVEYKDLYHRMTQHEMVLPESVLVFKLLDGANLKDDEKKLALALGNDLKLKTMKFVLKRIFARHAGSASENHTAYFNDKQDESLYRKGSKLNPSHKYDYISRCAVCDSMMHCATECPHAQCNHTAKTGEEDNDHVEKVNVVYLAEDTDKYKILVEEANSAVINTMCTETVAGEQWFDNYTKKLSILHQKGIEIYPSTTVFKFGGGSKVKAIKTAVFPVKIASTICKLEAEIVEEHIPLLLGKTSLKKAGTVIDIQNDKAKMFDKEVDLHLSGNGHYYINIFPEENDNLYLNHEGSLMLEDDLSPSTQKEKMIQLHNQFGHATAENLKRIVRNAGIMNSNLCAIIDTVVEECNTCVIVGLSESDDFNQRVFIGFHELQPNVWYMHIIDEFTRFSNAAIIRNKHAAVRTFLKCWLSLFGAPREIFSDNRSEFTGVDFFEMCNSFGIKMSKSPSSSPWSNGVCERHNQTLTAMLLEIQEDNKCGWETALVWAISAKNAIINHSGLSPAQLVFGRIGKYPRTLTDDLPSLDNSLDQSTVELEISSALHKTRKVREQRKEKDNKDVKKQTEHSFNRYENNEEIYYKREVTQHWNGSTRILVPVLLLRKGTEYVKAHVCRVQSINNETPDITEGVYQKEGAVENDVPNDDVDVSTDDNQDLIENNNIDDTSIQEDKGGDSNTT